MLQITAETLQSIINVILGFMAHHAMLKASFPSDHRELLYTLNNIANKALEGGQPNKYFAALVATLDAVPDVVQQRGPAQVDMFKTLIAKCLSKLSKLHLSGQVRGASPPLLMTNLDMSHRGAC